MSPGGVSLSLSVVHPDLLEAVIFVSKEAHLEARRSGHVVKEQGELQIESN
jgi:hypothetical protein